MVTIFTSKDCPQCKILKKELKAGNVPYEEIDVETVDGMVKYYIVCDELNIFVSILPLTVVGFLKGKTWYAGMRAIDHVRSMAKGI